jgi:hypothetical protein
LKEIFKEFLSFYLKILNLNTSCIFLQVSTVNVTTTWPEAGLQVQAALMVKGE